jgi:hypothetical protein
LPWLLSAPAQCDWKKRQLITLKLPLPPRNRSSGAASFWNTKAHGRQRNQPRRSPAQRHCRGAATVREEDGETAALAGAMISLGLWWQRVTLNNNRSHTGTKFYIVALAPQLAVLIAMRHKTCDTNLHGGAHNDNAPSISARNDGRLDTIASPFGLVPAIRGSPERRDRGASLRTASTRE